MVDVRIILSALWIALMFVYQQGDALRLYSGDFKPGDELKNNMISPKMLWMVSAITMTIPVVMIILSLILNQPVNRWVNIIVAAFFAIYNLVGMPAYPSLYDRFLIFVGLVFNVMTIWYAWTWALP